MAYNWLCDVFVRFCTELEPEISIAAKTLESCLELLIPTPEEFVIPEVEKDISLSSTEPPLSLTECRKRVESESDEENAKFRETGIIDPVAHTVTVTLRPGD